MTYNKIPSLFDTNKFTVGFDKLLNEFDAAINNKDTYPPHDVVKYDDSRYEIRIAVAGFSKEELSIKLVKNHLTVSGAKTPKITDDESEQPLYIYRGIGTRHFKKNFTLHDSVKVCGSSFVDGILTIKLEVLQKDDIGETTISID